MQTENKLHFKTAVQQRDELIGRPSRNTMWDLLTLKDALTKKQQEELMRELRFKEKNRHRLFHLDQIH